MIRRRACSKTSFSGGGGDDGLFEEAIVDSLVLKVAKEVFGVGHVENEVGKVGKEALEAEGDLGGGERG